MPGFAVTALAIRAMPDKHGVQRFGETFRILDKRLQRNKPFLDEVGQFALRSVRQNFLSGGRPVKWRPLAKSTVESRVQGVASSAIGKVLKRAKAAEKRLAAGQSVSVQGRAALSRRLGSRSGGDILSARGRAAVNRRQNEIAPGGRTSNQPSHLRWKGRLFASLRVRTIAAREGVGTVQVYSISKYARIHQLGGKIHIPGDAGSEGISLENLKRREARAADRKVQVFKRGKQVVFTQSVKAHDIKIPKRPFLLWQPTDPKSVQEIARRYLNTAIQQAR